MKIVIKATRMGPNGSMFITYHELEHTPIKRTPDVAGWNGDGAGLSPEDYKHIIELLDEWACNVHKLSIKLV